MQARVVGAAGGGVLGVGTGRVVAQAGDAPADLVPGLVQVAQRRAEHRLGVAPDLRPTPRSFGLADDVAVLPGRARAGPASPRRARAVGTWITAPSSSLNSACSVSSLRRAPTCAAQFFESPYSARLSLMPSPSVTSRSTLRLTPEVAGERHLADRGPQAAVAAVVVGEQLPCARSALIAATSDLSSAGSSRSGTASPNWSEHLRQHRAAHAVRPRPRSIEDQRRVAGAAAAASACRARRRARRTR